MVEPHRRIYNIYIRMAHSKLTNLRIFKSRITKYGFNIREQLPDKVKQYSRILSTRERNAYIPFKMRVPLDYSCL